MTRRRAIGALRVAVGIAQMTMALVTLALYLQIGPNVWSYGALAVTMLLVVGSRVTFRDQPVARVSPAMKNTSPSSLVPSLSSLQVPARS